MSAFSKELRSFIVVSQSPSIRAAATTLNLSAPALSRQLQILERSYGTQLLSRSTSGVVLTSDGEALRDEARRWLAADAVFSRRLHQDQSDTDLRVRLGIMEGLVTDVLPRLTTALEGTFGVVELDLTVGPTDQVVERAEAGELDLIIAFNTPRLTPLVVVESREYHLGAVYASSLSLEDENDDVDEGPVSLATLLRHPLCLPSDALSLHTRLLAEILSERVNPRVALTTNSIRALIGHLRAGRGIGFLTWPDVAHEVEAGALVFRPIDNRRLTESLSVAICRGSELGDATGGVVEAVRGVLDAVGE